MPPNYRERYLQRLPERIFRSGVSRLRTDTDLVQIVRNGSAARNEWRDMESARVQLTVKVSETAGAAE